MSSDMDALMLRSAGILRVNEVYDRPTVQGEGPHVGRVCTFVRLYGCNLHCRWCDTPYTWDTRGRNGVAFPRVDNSETWPVAEVVARVLDVAVPLVVVSGGEPLLQWRGVHALADALADEGVETHVETNGTLFPTEGDDSIAHYSVSPKLSSADAGRPATDDVLHAWATHPRAVFKIVCATPDDVAEAVSLFNRVQVPYHARWIMPEGRTTDDVDRSLRAVIDAALLVRCNVSPRLHVTLWGSERGR